MEKIALNKDLTNLDWQAVDEKIMNICVCVGIPFNIKGYRFLREAIKQCMINPTVMDSITKDLYPSVAEAFNTTSSKVECGIRHAILVAWNKGTIINLNSLFNLPIYQINEKPTNGQFIALLAEKILLESR